MSVNLTHKYFFHTVEILTCRKILRHGADGFTFPLEEVVLLIIIALKNPLSSTGF
jgi:hypothetical protein